jgi:predicted ester cyclase
MPTDPKVPKTKKRMPPKVRAFRHKMGKRNEKVQELVADHLHAAHEGRLAPDTPPAAAEPPFPKIPGLTDVRLSLDSQFTRKDKVATRWTVYADHSGPVAGIPPSSLEITVTGMTLSHLNEDGTAVESHVSFYDQPALMQQLRVRS